MFLYTRGHSRTKFFLNPDGREATLATGHQDDNKNAYEASILVLSFSSDTLQKSELNKLRSLEERIKQHIPKSITNPPTPHIRQSLPRPGKATSPRQFHKSAIGQHRLDNAECALHYNKDKFSVLARARTSFHLSALEATFIKSLNPLLYKQKEFVYSLKIS